MFISTAPIHSTLDYIREKRLTNQYGRMDKEADMHLWIDSRGTAFVICLRILES